VVQEVQACRKAGSMRCLPEESGIYDDKLMSFRFGHNAVSQVDARMRGCEVDEYYKRRNIKYHSIVFLTIQFHDTIKARTY